MRTASPLSGWRAAHDADAVRGQIRQMGEDVQVLQHLTVFSGCEDTSSGEVRDKPLFWTATTGTACRSLPHEDRSCSPQRSSGNRRQHALRDQGAIDGIRRHAHPLGAGMEIVWEEQVCSPRERFSIRRL